MKHILKYLQRTRDIVLAYKEGDLRANRFINSNFQSDVDDRKFTSGFIFIMNGGEVN